MKVLVLLSSLLLVFMVSCKSPVVPEKKKSPREYTWTKTVLADGSYPVYWFDIWGSSPADVYMVGAVGVWWKGKMWHFDGKEWTDITMKYLEAIVNTYPQGKRVYYWSPEGVWGFGPNNVWIVGGRDTSETPAGLKEGFVIHYNGQKWVEIPIQNAYSLFAVWGTSAKDLWVAGAGGKFFHFNGATWTPYSVGDTIFVAMFSGKIGSNIYAVGFNLSPGGREYASLLEWNGAQWRIAEVSVGPEPRYVFTNVTVIGGYLYSPTWSSVVRKRVAPNTWESVFEVPGTRLVSLTGDSESNLLVVGYAETILHYNGQDVKRLTTVSNTAINYYTVYTIENEAFVLGREYGGSYLYVMHGK